MLQRVIFGIIGVLLFINIGLLYFHSIQWVWMTLFIALNMFQFAFTKFCLMAIIIKKIFPKLA